MSNGHPTKVLLVDDSENDYIMIKDMINRSYGQDYIIDWTETFEDGLESLFKKGYDICMVDYTLGQHSGIDFIKRALHFNMHFPLILLTGSEDRNIDIRAQQVGASDYLVKSQITAPLLERALRYAIERAKSEKRLLELAHKDGLTGMANRTLFHLRLEDALIQSKRTGYQVAVIALDIDNFKEINENFGHPVADTVLCKVSERLKQATRETDTIARLGGDEFSVVATNITSETDAEIVSGRFLAQLSEPVIVEDTRIDISASIGIVISTPGSMSAEQMIKNSDEALYQAKSIAPGYYHFFNPDMQKRRIAAKKFEKELARSIVKNELFVVYQPIISLADNKVTGAEALVRWQHPSRGFVPPDEFIGVAEKTGFINELGEWVLYAACKACKGWIDRGYPDFTIAVNVSIAQIKKGDFIDIVQQVMEDTGLSYKNLTLEITESMMADDAKLVSDTLCIFKKLGISISVDDFGTGHSSLSRLKNFPIDYLKVDQSLLTNVGSDQQDSAIAVAILTLAQELQLDVVGEGIETEKQAEFLRSKNCSHAQGYFFGRPVTHEDFQAAWIDNEDTQAKSA